MSTAFEKLKMGVNTYDAVFFAMPGDEQEKDRTVYPFEENGITFTSIIQYQMYHKCRLFGDNDSALSILETQNQNRQYELARACEVYNDHVWKGARQPILIHGLLEQFRQNPKIKEDLLATGNAFLVCCSNLDVIYACGRRPESEKRFDAERWRGRNALGFALMTVRDLLRAEQ